MVMSNCKVIVQAGGTILQTFTMKLILNTSKNKLFLSKFKKLNLLAFIIFRALPINLQLNDEDIKKL